MNAVKAKSILPIATAVLIALSGCTQDYSARCPDGIDLSTTDPNEEIASFHTLKNESCNLTNDTAPILAERKSFESRVDPSGRWVNSYIPVNCLMKHFTASQIEYWAAHGDPVAKFVLVYLKYPKIANSCKDLKIGTDQLIEIYNYKSNYIYKGSFLSRVPESMDLMNDLHFACQAADPAYTGNLMLIYGINPHIHNMGSIPLNTRTGLDLR